MKRKMKKQKEYRGKQKSGEKIRNNDTEEIFGRSKRKLVRQSHHAWIYIDPGISRCLISLLKFVNYNYVPYIIELKVI